MMYKLLIILTTFSPIYCFSQEKNERVFYNEFWQEADSINAKYVSDFIYIDSQMERGKIITKKINGQLRSICNYSDIKKRRRDGAYLLYYDNGQLKSKTTYVDGKLNGDLTTFYQDGQVKRKDLYKNGTLVEGQCFTRDSKDTTYFEYEISPKYIGGEAALTKFISENIKYPKKAIRDEIIGKVIVGFTVTKNGDIANIYIKNPVDPLLDKEALRVVSLIGKWTPCYLDGEPIPTLYTLPINFKLKNGENYKKGEFSFIIPEGWKISKDLTTPKNWEYVSCAKKTLGASGLVIIKWIKDSLNLEERLKTQVNDLELGFKKIGSTFKSGEIQHALFNSENALKVNYETSLLLVGHSGEVYCFYLCGHTVLYYVQGANEDLKENKKGFEEIKISFSCSE